MKALKIAALALGGLLIFASIAVVAKTDKNKINASDKKKIEKIVHDYLLNNPQILVEVSQKLQEQQQQEVQQMEEKAKETIPSLAKQLYNDNNSPSIGQPTSKVTVVEFFDYQCPHCRDMSPILEQLVKNNKDVRVVFKEFPIFGKISLQASQAALAANMQGKYLAMHNALMDAGIPLSDKKITEAAQKAGVDVKQMKKDMESQKVRAELEQNLMLSQKLGLMGTPAFVIGNTQKGSSPDVPVFFIPGTPTPGMIQDYVQKIREG